MKKPSATTQAQEASQNAQLTFYWEGSYWCIAKVSVGDPSPSPGTKPPRVPRKQGTVSWKLPDKDLDYPDKDLNYVVLQLNPTYFKHVDGAQMDADTGIIILAKNQQGHPDHTKLKVVENAIPSSPQGGGYFYVYTALCMNEDGEVEDIEEVLDKGDVEGWLRNKDLTFATGQSMLLVARASPPSMIIM